MKENKTNISINRIIIIVFIIAMLVTISGIGILVFSNWFSSTKGTTESIAEDINNSIHNQISSFIDVPNHINEVNHKIIENDILDLSDDTLRDKFFVGVLSSHSDEIYSFSYGTANGEYYGARRNEQGIIEIMRNNAATGGSSWYYSVNEDMTAGELVVKAGQFDPRTRAWYKSAAEAGKPVFSPVYKHFVMDDLTVSAAWPVYAEDGKLRGVFGAHMLLTDIGSYLSAAVEKYNGYAVIIEKASDDLIANSMGLNNYGILSDGALERYGIDEIETTDIKEAYEEYSINPDTHFLYEGGDQNLYINIKEIRMEGLDWVIISAFPEELLIAPVKHSIRMTILLAVIALLVSFVIYNIFTGRLLKPISSLLKVSEALSSGDLTSRVDIVRRDEIGIISEGVNKVADKMQYLINNLETNVKERTEELHRTNITLEENKDQLLLILDSTAEAIYGLDLQGNCTFCNNSCIRLLGYDSYEDLLGKNMHMQIHHTQRDNTPFPLEECRIYQSIRQGKGFTADDEVFWKVDGTCFDVEYHAYPQIKNGEVIGGVVTFTDITDRKQKEEKIWYLSSHDSLTGLHNRSYFKETQEKIDTPDNLPLSVVFADINGLKMTNDIFGHTAGDMMIKKSAEILMSSCRDNDAIARVGGDEFVILLPRTDEEGAGKLMSRIKSEFLHARVEAIKCSISLGADTKTSVNQSLEEIMANAENAMYRDKTLNRKSVNKDIIDTIVETLHSRSPREKQHSIAVSEICGEIGSALHLPETEISKLIRAGHLHDIGKIILDDSTLAKDSLTVEETEIMLQHPIVGYRILNLFDDTLDLAEYVYSHHERWDGKGFPRGLKGEQIPLISRIISIAETYERAINRGDTSESERKKLAVELIKLGVGKRFDPHIAELLIQIANASSLEEAPS